MLAYLSQHIKIHKNDPLLILRGIAILSVVIWHSFSARIIVRLGGHELLYLLPTSGYSGVWIFICLSGYLMGKIFYSGKYDLSPSGILRYYYNRIIRIEPLYIFIILFTTFTVYKNIPVDKTVIFKLLTFTANDFFSLKNYNENLWTISLLMQFYFVVPLLFMTFRYIEKKRIPVTFLILVIMFVGFFIRLYTYRYYALTSIAQYVSFIYTPFITNIDIFIFSFLLNNLVKRIKNSSQLYFFNKYISFALLVLLFLIGNYYTLKVIDNYFDYARMFILFLPVLTYIFIGYFILTVEINKQCGQKDNINNKSILSHITKILLHLLTQLGVISFGVYLWHWPVMDLFKLHAFGTDSVLISINKAVLTICISVIFATITYYIIEKPFSRLKKIYPHPYIHTRGVI